MTDEESRRLHPAVLAVTITASVAAILVGLGLVLLAAALGSCEAFGGRCPADRPSLWNDDVFGMAAFGTAMAIVVPYYLRRPSWPRLGRAVAIAAIAALIVGLLVTNAAHG